MTQSHLYLIKLFVWIKKYINKNIKSKTKLFEVKKIQASKKRGAWLVGVGSLKGLKEMSLKIPTLLKEEKIQIICEKLSFFAGKCTGILTELNLPLKN